MRAILLALALLIVPAFAKENQRLPASPAKPHCVTSIVQAVNATLAFRSCPEMLNWFRATHLAKQELFARPCELKGRVRSKADGKCYLPERLP